MMKETSRLTPKNKALIRRLSIVILSLGLLLAATPFAIQYAISQGLKSVGSHTVKLKDVDFNPFTGKLVIKGLQTDNNGQALRIPLLSVELNWLPLFKKQISVESVLLQNSQISIEQHTDGKLFIAGIELPKNKPVEGDTKGDKPSWGIGIKGISLSNNHITFNTPAFSTPLKIDNLSLNSLSSWKPLQATNVSFLIHIGGAPVSTTLEIFAFAENPHLKGVLKIDNLALDNFNTQTANTLHQLTGELSTSLDFKLSFKNNHLSYHQQGTIKLDKLQLSTDDIQLSQDQLTWLGEVDFSQHQQLNSFSATGDLTLDKHLNTLTSPKLETRINSASWHGQLNFNQRADQNELFIKGDLSANKVNTLSLSSKQTLLQLKQLALKGLAINQLDDIQLSNIKLDNLTLAKRAGRKPLIHTKSITAHSLELSKLKDIELEELLINNLAANININKQGNITLLDEFISSLKPSSQKNNAENTSPSKSRASAIRIGKINVTGNNPIKLSSLTTNGLMKKNIHLKSLNIGEINNQAPTVATPFKLHASINDFSKLSLDGKISPFSKKTNAQITGKLTALELPEFSPIIQQELGYDIESGQLNADIKGHVKKDRLDGKVKIAINKLIIQPTDQSKAAEITKQLSMPLDSALSLLRDKNDNIQLEIPIKGDIAQPDFDLGHVVNTAIGNALQGTVTSYLKYALQPYGLIYMAAETAYGAATKLSLEPVQFQSGGLLLPEHSNEYMQSIGQLMQKRPQLTIRLCGLATNSDRIKLIELNKQLEASKQTKVDTSILNEQLLALAAERQQLVKSYFINQYKIPENRLFTCLPKISDKKEPPQVELRI